MSTNFNVNGVDISNTFAPLASPALTGTPTAPTATSGTNTTQIATTAFVKNQGYALASSLPSLTGYAPLASPDFTGTPKAPTAPTDTNTEQIATTAFVMTQGSAIKSYVDNKTNSLSTLTNYASLANDNTFTKDNWFKGTVYYYKGSQYFSLKDYIKDVFQRRTRFSVSGGHLKYLNGTIPKTGRYFVKYVMVRTDSFARTYFAYVSMFGVPITPQTMRSDNTYRSTADLDANYDLSYYLGSVNPDGSFKTNAGVAPYNAVVINLDTDILVSYFDFTLTFISVP